MANVLLVDDDAVLTKLYSTRLTTDKHQVQVAHNGEEALNALGSFNPDVIVLDLMMPKVNGFKFLETIKKDPNRKNIPVIVFSSLASPEQQTFLKSQGVSDVYNKVDITPTQLVSVITKLLGPKT